MGITAVKIADGAITSAKIADATITTDDLASDAVVSAKLATGAVTTTKIQDSGVTSDKIADGTITDADINNSAEIAFSKLNITKSDIESLGIPGSDTDTTYEAGSGLSLNEGTFSINSSVVTSNYSGTITATAFTGDGSGLSNVSATVADDSITTTKIQDATITDDDISGSAAIAFTKLNISLSDITDLGIPSTNYSGTITANAFVGDGSGLTNIIATSVDLSSITTEMINDQAITNEKIAIGTITEDRIASDAITSDKILNYSITNDDISDSASIPYSKLNIYDSIMNNDISIFAGIQYSKLDLSESISNYDINPYAGIQYSKLDLYDSITNNDISYSAGISYNKLDLLSSITNNDISYSAGISYDKLDLIGSITNSDISEAASIGYSKLNLMGSIDNSDISSTTLIDFSKLNITQSDLELLGMASANHPGTISATAFVGDGSDLTSVLKTDNNLSDLNSASTARSNLGLAIGTDVQAYDTGLASIASLTTAADTMVYTTASDTYATTPLTSFARTILDDNSRAAMQTTLGLDFNDTVIFGALTSSGTSTVNVTSITNSNTGSSASGLKIQLSGLTSPASSNDYISFFFGSGNGTKAGSIKGNGISTPTYTYLDNSSSEAIAFMEKEGVVFSSTGADYAEYIQKMDITKDYISGELVGIKAGKIVDSTSDVDRVMSISARPIVIGNTPTEDEDQYELVAFVGQVFVQVRGPVESGQYIVASDETGVGIAKDSADMTTSDLKRVVGQAWETSPNSNLRLVKVGITPMDMALIQADRLTKLETQIETLLDAK